MPGLTNYGRVITLLLAVGLHLSARAAELTVDGSGGAQFRTISAAVAAAAEGDTIIVNPGNYGELLSLRSRRLTIRSSDPGDPAVVASTRLNGFSLTSGADVTVAGFTTSGAPGRSITADRSTIRLANCVWESNGCAACRFTAVFANLSVVEIADCTFRNNLSNRRGVAIEFQDCNASIHGCLFDRNVSDEEIARFEIYLSYTNTDFSQNTLLDDTLAVWNGTANISLCWIDLPVNWIYGIQILTADVVIKNSLITVRGTGFNQGIVLFEPPANLDLLQSSIVGLGVGVFVSDGTGNIVESVIAEAGDAVEFYSRNAPGPPVTAHHNMMDGLAHCIYKRSVGDLDLPDNYCGNVRLRTPGIRDTNGTPFIDDDTYTPGDPRLSAASPAIDFGLSHPEFGPQQRDLDGLIRIAGPRLDAGAFEYPARGDLDGDGRLTWFDVDPFVLALVARDLYEARYPAADATRAGDVNNDGRFDLFDIDAFVDCLVNTCP